MKTLHPPILKHITLLNGLIIDCVQSHSLAEISGKAIRTGIKILRADFAFAFLKVQKNELMLSALSPTAPFRPKLPRTNGLTMSALKKRSPIFIPHVSKDKRIIDHPEKMQSAVIIPVAYKGTAYGTLHFCYKKSSLSSKKVFFRRCAGCWATARPKP